MTTTREEIERVKAIHLLMNVATALNGEYYKPTMGEYCYEIQYNSGVAKVSHALTTRGSVAYFKTEELAKTAIKALGELTIRMALVGY
jgi:hypothetical protein